jgi:glycosyltransferase involved in cell wall biosynthesis
VRGLAYRRVERHNRAVTAAVVEAERPDVVFVWSPLRLSLGPARAAEASGRPVVYTLNDVNLANYIPPRGGWSLRAAARRARLAWRRHALGRAYVDDLGWRTVTCISHDLKRRLLAMGVPVPHAEVLHQGIPIDHFPAKDDPGALHDPMRVLFVGALLDYKGVHTIVDAAQRAAREFPVHLTIVGDSPDAGYKDRLRAAAAAGPARVEFLGFVPHAELPALYRAHDVFAFASRPVEGFGLTHLEAMASGTTVVATRSGGHAEALAEGENSLLFDADDAAGLAARLVELQRSPERSRRLARAGRARVEAEFTHERYVGRVEQLLRGVAEGARASLSG